MPDDVGGTGGGGGYVQSQQTHSGEADEHAGPDHENDVCDWSTGLRPFSFAMLAAAAAEHEMSAAAEEEAAENCDDDSQRQDLIEELNPVTKLERYAYSEIVFNRQMVARNIVDTLRAVLDCPENVAGVLAIMKMLAMDCEPSVRAELVDQLPNIANFCACEGGLLEGVVRDHIVPTIVHYLTDVTNQVRKRTQISLLFILERALIDRKQLEEQICSLVVRLTESETKDEHRTEAVTLMTKMAPYIGRDATVDLFLVPFVNLCRDSSFHVRKVCASNFGDFCSIVGQECTEDNLAVFHYLCEDSVWGVRKACAEVFMPVSCVCSLATRRRSLFPVFLHLLDDQSRWVRLAAFQALGPFISTFADPSRTGLYCSEDGVVSVRLEQACNTCPDTAPGKTASASASDVSPPADNTRDASSLAGNQQEQVEHIDLPAPKEGTGISGDDKGEPCGAPPHPNDLPSCWEDAAPANVPPQDPTKEGSPLFTESDFPSLPGMVLTSKTTQSERVKVDNADVVPVPPEVVGDDLKSYLAAEEVTTTVEDLPPPDPVSAMEEGIQSKVAQDVLFVEGDRKHLVLHVDSAGENNFNTFQFWRAPIPEVEVDIEFLGKTATAVHVRAKSQDQDSRYFSSDLSVELMGKHEALLNDASSGAPGDPGDRTLRIRTASLSSLTCADQECNVVLSSSVTEASVAFDEAGQVAGVHKVRVSELKAASSNILLSKLVTSSSDSWSASDQDIVPVELLERYRFMTDPTLVQGLDSEIGRHCAHSLPAVALTLGRRFWPCLRTTYNCLSSDVQWKVRHIVASCLHELATILGPQIASQDLVPSFEGFVRDVDEVRAGVLERLGLFLRGLSRTDQRRSLPLLGEFLSTDNHKNWRFRLTLARQMKDIAELYSASDVYQYLVPIVLELLEDKVAQVRRMSVQAVVALLQRLESRCHFCQQLLHELAIKVRKRKWSQRQLYCELAEEMVQQECVAPELFVVAVLPHLLYLRDDVVPNVRMALARCLTKAILTKNFFTSDGNPLREQLESTLLSLQEDIDRDVRFLAQPLPKSPSFEESLD